ncbi:MAG: hypothetical protein OEZ01_05725 [Candidatus Heimdallarchaeota archaeon]|nr:hypothetical protein [Candidatus Heimdallarchaeota archaeon]MDH5645484.1 hypothetical protein [Candidatus Heimdallarchaeota archaeon]
MSTVKFDRQEKLDELISRIYLDTKIKITKKDLLELIFDITSENYNLILQELIKSTSRVISSINVDEMLEFVQDFGPGSENLSESINNIVYNWDEKLVFLSIVISLLLL